MQAARRLIIEGLMILFDKVLDFWFDPEGKSLEEFNNLQGDGHSPNAWRVRSSQVSQFYPTHNMGLRERI